MITNTPDLMTFLKDEYKHYLEELGDQDDPTVVLDEQDNIILLDSFLNWARIYLANVNQPINVAYLSKGLGLRLQRGQTVGFITQDDKDQLMYDEGIPITHTRPNPYMEGVVPSESYPIFGKTR